MPEVFACRTCLGHNCSVKEKLEFKRHEDVLEEVEKFCYLADMISYYDGASESLSARIGSPWKKFRELSGVLFGKHGLSLKQWGKRFNSAVLDQFCCTVVKLTFANQARLRGVERRMIRMSCGVRLVDRVSTDVLRDRVSVAVKIEVMIIQSRGMITSRVETSIPKYVRLWKLK